MTEREYLLTAAAALLLLGVVRHFPPLYRRMGPTGCRLAALGVLVPLLDPLVALATTADRVAFLARPPLFVAPVHGIALIVWVAALCAFVMPARRAVRVGLWLGLGYALYLMLLVVTPAGVPLLAPYAPGVVSLPILPVGHPLLVGLLVVGLVSLEALRRMRRWLAPAVLALCAVYFAAAATVGGMVHVQARALEAPEGVLDVYPGNLWLTEWLAVWEAPDHYEFRRYTLASRTFDPPQRLSLWNDQPLLLKLMSDPVVRRFYYTVFRHPVVRIDVAEGEISLLMQEATDVAPPVPGRTFYVESDLRGSNRYYQLQRFD